MNDDLISRKALKEAIRKRLGISSLEYLTEQEKVIVDEIDNADSKRPTGHWIKRGFNEYCQFCNCMKWNYSMDFCGYCGADMRGGRE